MAPHSNSLFLCLSTSPAEDEMVGGHHRLNGHEFEQTPGVSDGQGDPRTAVHGVAESRARLSDWTTTEWDQNCFVNMNTLHLTTDQKWK